MAEDKPGSLYYGDEEGSSRYPFLPFILAPVRLRQDNVILGPFEISASQGDFINTLYAGIERSGLATPVARIVSFEGDLCIAVLIPTCQPDEAGRTGLILSFGFLVKRNFFVGGETLAAFLRACTGVLERNLAKDITGAGANRVVGNLQAAELSDSFEANLAICRDILLNISAAAGAWLPTRRFSLPWRKARAPKTMIFGSSLTSIEALCEILALSSRRISGYRVGRAINLWVIPWPTESWILENAKKVNLVRRANKPILVIEK